MTKIAVYTIHACYNYGAMFQAYATQVALERLGYEVEIINYLPADSGWEHEYQFKGIKDLKQFARVLLTKINPKARLKLKRFVSFHNLLNNSRSFKDKDELKQAAFLYDIHLVGSDQVWNMEYGISDVCPYFLDFLPRNVRKISYAASFGSDFFDNRYKEMLSECFSSFSKILVREHGGVELLKECGVESEQVLDPTFLPEPELWEKMSGEKPLFEGDYIFAYGFGDKEESNKILRNLRQKLGMPIVGTSISIISPHDYDTFYNQAGPIEFLNLMKNSKFVVTASYHGAAFAIHFRKNFLVKKHATRNSRMDSMLGALRLSDRQILTYKDIDSLFENSKLFFDYNDGINDLILSERQRSLSCLEKALDEKKAD